MVLLFKGIATPSGRKCYITPAFSGACKWAEVLNNPCILGGPQTLGDKIRNRCLSPAFSGPRRGRKHYITPAFSGVPNKGDNIKA